MRNIPNLFTLLNLIFGCIAIVLILQTGETIVVMDDGGAAQVVLPENMALGALFLFGAAVVDFLDGFLARLFKAQSAMGAQLDSLSDVVSFGVAPGTILYQLLRISYAQEEGGLDTPVLWLLPAFLFTAAVAWRLAKFNISTTQSYHFEGVPCPAAGLVVASFPLIILYGLFNTQTWFINTWVLYGTILLLGYLMVSRHPFMALKFTDYALRSNIAKYLLLLIAVLALIAIKWLAVPVIFLAYLVLSFIFPPKPTAVATEKEITDITV